VVSASGSFSVKVLHIKDEEEFRVDDFANAFKSSETVQAQMSVGEIVSALKNSCSFFMNFFLADELEFTTPEFHVRTWQYLINLSIEQVALALPRGHAKTTLAKLVCVWYFLFTPFRFIIYVSNTHSVAAEACRDVMNYIRSDNFVSVFGPVRFEVMQDQKGFYKFILNYIDETGVVREKYCILKALGAGQQIRGLNIDNTRPELAIADDLEDQDNTATPILIKKLAQWFFGAFFKALSRRRRKIIYIGNMLSNRSLLYHFCEKSDEWHSLRYGCILGDGTPLWPDMWPFEKIKSDFEEYRKLNLTPLWFAEMMNLPVAEGNLLIESDDIPYSPILIPGEHKAAFLTIDPAISEKTWADDRAIVVHALSPMGHWQIVDYVLGKFPPDQMFWLVVELCQKWSTRVVGIEQAGYQMALKFLIETLGAIHHQHFEIVEIPHKNKSKVERLAVWCSLLRKKAWALNEGDYAVTEQLLSFDPMKKTNIDDLIDACSMGVTMIDLYLPSIMDSYAVAPVKDQYRVRTGREVARI
jgi:hypothetical protein